MGGATAAQAEGPAGAAAIAAGCDVLLYPTDWHGVIRALDAVPAERAEEAGARYEEAVAKWGRGTGDGGGVDDARLAEHGRVAGGRAEGAVQAGRGEAPRLARRVVGAAVADGLGRGAW